MTDLQRLTPHLMFQKGDAEDAMNFYLGLFDDGEILSLQRYAAGEPGTEGQVKLAVFRIAGQQVQCSDSPPIHDFDFTPSLSLFVRCRSSEELDRLWDALSAGGTAFMPLDDYGFGPFGFTGDRFGVSWQLGLAEG